MGILCDGDFPTVELLSRLKSVLPLKPDQFFYAFCMYAKHACTCAHVWPHLYVDAHYTCILIYVEAQS